MAVAVRLGEGEAALAVATGEFEIRPDAAYRIKTDHDTLVKADPQGRLAFLCRLAGLMEIAITPINP